MFVPLILTIGAATLVALGMSLSVPRVPAPAEYRPTWAPLDVHRHRAAIRRVGLVGFDDRVELRISHHHVLPGRRGAELRPPVHVGVFNRSTGSHVGSLGVGATVTDALRDLSRRADPRFFDKYRSVA